MQLKSLEKVLDGVGKLRAASVVAAVASSATLLGLNIPASVQASGLVAVAIVLAIVNLADALIRGAHAKALPALIAQGAESVAQVQDPRVDAVAQKVDEIASRVAAVEAQPAAPQLAEIIAGLTGKTPDVPATPAPAPAPQA